jgi:predicted enzyme related to lactoylglutathione lyase
MHTRLGRAIILVENYDEALRFYEENFLCKKIFDATAPNGQRYLHIAFSEDDEVGIWFLKAEGTDQRNKIGKQTEGQPTLVIYTNDINALYEHIRDNGVRITESLITSPDSKFFHCLDLYGNRLTVVELNQR